MIDLWDTVAPVLADNLYLVLGTADAAGNPWVSPVFFAARDEHLLFWVSSPDSRHSRNIDVQPIVAITVFDSRAAIGSGDAVYLRATAGALSETAASAGLVRLNLRLPADRQLRAWMPAHALAQRVIDRLMVCRRPMSLLADPMISDTAAGEAPTPLRPD